MVLNLIANQLQMLAHLKSIIEINRQLLRADPIIYCNSASKLAEFWQPIDSLPF